MKNKAIPLLLVTLLLLAGFTGCAKSEEATVTRTITGQVTAIDGSNITLALGDQETMPSSDQQSSDTSGAAMQTPPSDQGGAPGAQGNPGGPGQGGGVPPSDITGGTPPEGTADGTPPAAPGATSGGAMTGNGETPGDKTAAGGGFTLTGEEQQITLTDETTILIDNMGESVDGSLSDITVGCYLSVTMTGDTVTEVILFAPHSNAAVPAGETAE